MKQAVKDTLKRMNAFGKKGQPFFFLINFLKTRIEVYPFDILEKANIRIVFPGFKTHVKKTSSAPLSFIKSPMTFNTYHQGFQKAMKAINHGDSYLLNLTYPTPIETNWSMNEMFEQGQPKYKVKYNDEFVVFSPETFIRIDGRIIRSYPMKGTLDAAFPNARKMLLDDPKELAEHNTIVDLIRNDLSMVAKKVRLEKFRYVEKIQTHHGELLQTSSIISGELPDNWRQNIGDLIFKLLPAGSISGAPKKRTLEIIDEAEGYDRGWFTGVCGFFDGKNLDSAVMIRFIENRNGSFIFKSGGGITCFSKAKNEFSEMLEKVYIPVQHKKPSSEPTLFETLRIEKQSIQHINYHNARMNASRKALFGMNGPIGLKQSIKLPKGLSNDLYKCRVLYAENILQIEFELYKRREIKSLKCVCADELEYGHKLTDRFALARLTAKKGNCDDVLIIRNGWVSDTSFANIVFWDGRQWLTPSTPLLPGTTRARLLDEGKIKEVPIAVNEILNFKKARIINTLNDLDESADIFIHDITMV